MRSNPKGIEGEQVARGYSTYGFHSPHPGYCVNPAEADREYRALMADPPLPWAIETSRAFTPNNSINSEQQQT